MRSSSCIFPVYNLLCHFLHPQWPELKKQWINIYLFELFVTCIETHILVPNVSIYHIFISIIKFFCLLLLEKIPNLNLQHSKKYIQHNIYTIFKKISSFSSFIFCHTRLQHVALTTREDVFIFHISSQVLICIGIWSRDMV